MDAARQWRFPFERLVLVADRLPPVASNLPIDRRRDLEKTAQQDLGSLLAALATLSVPVVHLESPAELSAQAGRFRSDLVLSIYGGAGSRNRMALVPAICEAHGIAFVGPDVYGRVICQDKEISKRLARDCGVLTPRYRILRSESDTCVLSAFHLPFVLKPLLEGSSIGISQRNIVRETAAGRSLASELFAAFNQPLMAEEFVGGREVSYNAIDSGSARHWAFSEVFVEGAPGYFDTRLFDADEKLHRRLPRTVRTIDEELSCADKQAIDHFLDTLDGFGYCRVDGKLLDGRFHFLEVTPDAWIAPPGAFAASFMNKGWSYEDVIRAVISSGRQGPPAR